MPTPVHLPKSTSPLTADAARHTAAEEVLAYWMRERDAIRVRRSLGLPPPWSADPNLRDWRYCNVRRADDKVTDWLLRHWYRPYKDHPNMVPAVVLARHFNKIETLEAIGFPVEWVTEKMKAAVNALRAGGNTVFSAAYIIRASGEYPDKVDMVFDETVRAFRDRPPAIDTDSMEKSVAVVAGYRNLGSFMAGQVVADLRWALSGSWRDRQTWAPVGPGSSRGLARLLKGDDWETEAKRYAADQPRFLADLTALRARTEPLLPADLTKRLEMMDWQNCLCEMSGYLKVLLDGKRKKQCYPPR